MNQLLAAAALYMVITRSDLILTRMFRIVNRVLRLENVNRLDQGLPVYYGPGFREGDYVTEFRGSLWPSNPYR